MPGVKRLFVRTDGALFPCERVNELFDFFKIGTLDGGIDMGKVKNILNVGKLTENECKACWGIRQCMLCSGNISFEEDLSGEEKLKECPGCLSRVSNDLVELCVLNEFGFDAERVVSNSQ